MNLLLRLKMAWHVLYGKPLTTGVKFKGGICLDSEDVWVVGNAVDMR